MSYKILLIEDNAEMAENISSILELASYEVFHAPNGKMGVDLAKHQLPHLILCDIMMPELDGYGVLHILNNLPETANIPFIFLTAKADKDDFRTGMNLGADDYITKPFDGVDLLKVVEMRLKKSGSLLSQAGNNRGLVDGVFSKNTEVIEFNKLLENRRVRTHKRKDIIFMEGQSPNELYFIEQGKVKTYKINYDGKELINGIYKAGDFLGYVPLLEEKPYNENAEAMEEVKLAIIPRSEFLSLVYSSKDFAQKFIKMLSNNLDELEDRLLNIAYQSLRQRVAVTLVQVNEKLTDSDPKRKITLSRKDLAKMVGTATESLNRTLADFRDEKLIEIADDGLKIINKPKLERLFR